MLKCAIIGVILAIFVIILYDIYNALYFRDKFTIHETNPITSDIDGMPYRVHTGHTSYKDAANLMATLHRRIVAVLTHLRKKYIKTPTAAMAGTSHVARANMPRNTAKHITGDITQRATVVSRILARYNPDNIVENSPQNVDNDTSYTIGKGSILAVCLRDKDTMQFHDINILMFVVLHEITHIGVDEPDHPPIFWRTFKFILEEAVISGEYKPVNYTRYPVFYCRMMIEYNPLFDANSHPI